MCASVVSCFSHVQLCMTLWTVACQAPLSTGFSRQAWWTGMPRPLPGDLPTNAEFPKCGNWGSIQPGNGRAGVPLNWILLTRLISMVIHCTTLGGATLITDEGLCTFLTILQWMPIRHLWSRKWQATPVFLPGESCGQRSLAGYSPWGRKESDTS